MLQIVTILILMLAAPVAAIAVHAMTTGGGLIALAGKWFVFFVGLRLLIAGLYQLVSPTCPRRPSSASPIRMRARS